MKKQALLVSLPILLLFVLVWTGSLSGANSKQKHPYTYIEATTINESSAGSNDRILNSPNERKASSGVLKEEAESKELISYALSFLGTPYIYAGMTPKGFDCSGFITYVYRHFNIKLPHSSAMQSDEGNWVPKSEARTGDLVIFTGTNPKVRRPGHVGIVISSPGDTIEFVHSSSNGGVKISKVQGTRYDTRFLEVRRVL